METRALIGRKRDGGRLDPRRPPTSRTLTAAVLLAVMLSVLLGAWFISGWHDVRMRQHEVRAAPTNSAAARADELARELRDELDALVGREARRPYFHYQNLMHDPRGSVGLSVSPSPLAKTPEDKLVLGYFQIDGKGRATTPTVNDEVPELSDSEHLATNRAFRDQVVRDLVRELGTGALVAQAPPQPQMQVPPQAQAQEQQQQVIQIDQNAYVQNAAPNAVYWQQYDNNFNPNANPRIANVPPPGTAITVTISPLEWRTLPFAGTPSLVAVRQVQTPDGNLSQGFVIDRATLTSRLAARAGDMVAELHPRPSRANAELVAEPPRASRAGVEVAPNWELTVAPNPRALSAAAAESSAVARNFMFRFVGVGALAAIVAGFVLVLVMRAEQLARERSQFAASAAHELRTPLAGLQLYGDMLADGLGDQNKVRDYARRMSEEAARLGRVVSNVLGFSQLERGNLSVDAQLGPIGEALCELADRAQPALDRAGAALDLDVPPELRARFDRDALARIVGNLLDNAEKYSRTATDRTIRLAAVDKGDVVEVTVADHGPGVADHTKLFEPFSRGVPSDGPAGLGLGLALSQSLAHAMGGELAYQAAEGGGALFTLRLPRA